MSQIATFYTTDLCNGIETKTFNSINYIKKVTLERIIQNIKRKNVFIENEYFQTVIDNLFNSSKLDFRKNDSEKSFFIPGQSSQNQDIVLAHERQEVNETKEENENSEDLSKWYTNP